MSPVFRTLYRLSALALLLSACNAPAATTSPSPPTPAPPTAIAPTSPPTQPPATATASPTPDPYPDPVLKVSGDMQVVYDWSKDRCASINIPDLPARAFRNAQNQVELILSHITGYRMIGPDLDHLKVDCHPISTSDHNADPAKYDDNEWIAAPYTEDGNTVYALVHDEYHGQEHPGVCPGTYQQCWFNALTLSVSTDGGQTFKDAAQPPANLVADLPYKYQPMHPPWGVFEPSNIIKYDGDYYAYAQVITYQSGQQYICAMRSTDLSDPTSWRYWDGTAFEGTFVDPYTTSDGSPSTHVCPPLAMNQIGSNLGRSITYNTAMKRFVMVGLSADQIGGREVWGVYYSFSHDLVTWTHRKLLMEIPLPWTVANGGSDLSYLYPALLDPSSTSRNFETTGMNAYVYLTRHNHGQGSLDRDLVRVPVTFYPSEAAAPSQ